MNVELSEEAEGQVDEIDAWWRANRLAAPDLFAGELEQALSRNIERFPADFMFPLTSAEARALRSQSVISNVGRGGRRHVPHAFTEQGVPMLSSVLRSRRAAQVNVEIMRAFVRLRQMMQHDTELALKLAKLERKYDARFKVVFDAIRELMTPPANARKRIGFRSDGA